MGKKFVRIQSTMPIVVTGGLQNINATNEESNSPERLNIRQMWSSIKVQLANGIGYYPSVVKEWNTVKALSAKGILTVGEEVDEVPEQFAEKANEIYDKLSEAIGAFESAKKAQEARGKSASTQKKKATASESAGLFED